MNDYGLEQRDDGKWVCPNCEMPALPVPAMHGCPFGESRPAKMEMKGNKVARCRPHFDKEAGEWRCRFCCRPADPSPTPAHERAAHIRMLYRRCTVAKEDRPEPEPERRRCCRDRCRAK